VERGDERQIPYGGFAEQVLYAFAHFGGGLVGEGHGENAWAGNVVLPHQMRHPVRDHARFSATRSSKDQERTFDVRNCSLLFRIEALKKVH
jgi:hypothetical protein